LLGGASLLPYVLRREIIAALAKSTPATVHLTSVHLHPLGGLLTLSGLSLTLPGESRPVIAADTISGSIRFLSLLRGERVIETLSLSGARIALVRESDGHFNLTRLFPPSPSEPPPETDLPTLTIGQLRLSEVEVDYRDAAHALAKPTMLALSNLTTNQINIQAKGFAAPVNIQLRGVLDTGEVAGEGQVYWSRSETRLDATMTIQRLALAHIEPYLRETLSVQELSGEIGTHLHYRLQSGGALPSTHALDGAVTLANLSFVDPSSGQTALHVQDGRIAIDQVDLLRHDIRLAAVELRNPQVLAFHTPTGLNWAHFLVSHDDATTSEEQQSGLRPTWRSNIQSVKVIGGEITYRDSEWQETETIKISPEEVELRELSDGTTESPLRFSVHVGEGQLSGAGAVQLSPLRIQAQSQLSKLTLSSFQPILARLVKVQNAEGTVSGDVRAGLSMAGDEPLVSLSGEFDASEIAIDGLPAAGNLLAWTNAHITVREGSSLAPLSLDTTAQLTNLTLQRLPQGDLSLEQATGALQLTRRINTRDTASPQLEQATTSAAEPVDFDVQGTFEVKSFLLAQGSEKEELLSCYQARGQVKTGSRLLPLDLHFADVTLEYPYAQGFRTTNGRFQLANPSSLSDPAASIPTVTVESSTVSTSSSSAQSEVAPSEKPPLVRIDRVVLIGGQVYFEDHAIAPPQTIYWQDIRVDLSDVGYPLERPAAFALHAFNMDGAPIEVSGTTERQNNQLVTRVHGAIDHMTLTRFNAYLTPVLGYQVRKGAVSVKWELMMPGDLLQASAAVTLHDLGLSGKQSTSDLEQQVGLPMSLIIALLKDLNGNINLQLPVEGRWSEPGFRLSGTLWRAIRDVLIGAVTSPLKLLGAIFSSEDTLENFSLEPIPFTPGTNQPSPAGKEQLNRLRMFLTQRPGLDVQLSGAIGSADQAILRDRLLLTQLEGAAPPTPTPSAEQAEAEPSVTPEEEVRRFLSHRLEQGEEQATPLSEPAAALLHKLRDQTAIEPRMLEQLSRERVQAVRAALTENLGVAAERLHLSPDKPRGRGAPEVQYMIQAREDRKKK
jgi:uncharacterized protein involved in outer membrane biogenesis